MFKFLNDFEALTGSSRNQFWWNCRNKNCLQRNNSILHIVKLRGWGIQIKNTTSLFIMLGIFSNSSQSDTMASMGLNTHSICYQIHNTCIEIYYSKLDPINLPKYPNRFNLILSLLQKSTWNPWFIFRLIR